MLRLPDQWVWDSWVADDGEQYHLFFLQAPRSLGDQDARHLHARVGHAVSTDLSSWTVLPDALVPEVGGWDDLAVWTGSVVRGDDDRWRMFYTALGGRGHAHRDQRIGVATSADLTTWTRSGAAPVLEVDTRWYAALPEDPTASETWRDPFVVPDPAGEGWQMLFTARAARAPRFDDGVVGNAWSADLQHWEVRPPLSRPGHGFGQLEVINAHHVGDRWVLVFTCQPDEQSPQRRAAYGEHSTWSVTADHLLGPWDLARAVPFAAEPRLFAAQLVRRHDGSRVLLGFQNHEPHGPSPLEVVDPIPVVLGGDGLVSSAG